MTLTTSSPTLLFTMYRGDDKSFTVTVIESGSDDPGPAVAVPITGWVLKATMKKDPSVALDTDAPVQVDVAALPDNADSTAGTFVLTLPAAQTANLQTGLYYFDLQGEISGLVTTIIQGRVNVLPDVTRRTG